VREWVQDIPWPADAALRPLVAGAMRNHRSHLAQAVLGPTGLVDAQRIELSRLAAVRGRDLADGRPVVDLVSGQRLGPSDRLTAGVAGVVTTVNVPRDGRGIDGPHRLLNQIGIRLAGGEAFVDKVRRR
jgi:hypothetical protein